MSYSRDKEAGKGRRGSIFDGLFDFQYSPTSPESWIRFACQVTIAGAVVILIKSVDGDVCGQPWSFWQPQTWGIPSGCFVRGLVKGVPNDFNQPNISTTPDASGDAVTPPANGTQQGQ